MMLKLLDKMKTDLADIRAKLNNLEVDYRDLQTAIMVKWAEEDEKKAIPVKSEYHYVSASSSVQETEAGGYKQ